MTYVIAKFEAATSNGQRGDAFTRKYVFFDIGVQAHKMLLHVTYAPAKFEVAMSNGLGGDAFTRKYILWP